jgi:hypothetical protein
MQAARENASGAVTRSTMVLMRSGVASENLIAATPTPVSLISVKASVRSARVPDENAVLGAVARR